jgi:hypothetical protein
VTEQIALVTSANVGDLDQDMAPLRDALARHEVTTHVVSWDDPTIDWSTFALVIVRSTWDYIERRPEFLAWAEHVHTATMLCNPPEVLAWSTDKRYLRDLAQHEVPCVATVFFEPGDPVHVPPIEVVVKPAISAGSVDAGRYAPSERDAALAHVERLTDAGRVALVQPYQAAIDAHGETGLVYLAGVFSHAFRKGPLLARAIEVDGAGMAKEQIDPRTATADERAVGDAVIATITERFGRLLYARVDLVPGPDGAPLVLECELVEPSLWVKADGTSGVAASERFAAAVVDALEHVASSS